MKVSVRENGERERGSIEKKVGGVTMATEQEAGGGLSSFEFLGGGLERVFV